MSNEIEIALKSIEEKVDSSVKSINAQCEDSGKATAESRAEMKSLLTDWNDIQKEFKAMKGEVEDLQQKGVNHQSAPEVKTAGQMFTESAAFKSFRDGGSTRARVEMKNTIVNDANDTSRHDQLPGLVPGAFRQLSILPTVSRGTTGSNQVSFSRELSFTNNAAGTAEGATKPESVLTFEEVTKLVKTIPHFLKASKQALDDSSFLASYIDRRMSHGVNQKVESQLVNGDGTGQNLDGWLATGNNVLTAEENTVDIYGLANKMKAEITAADYMADFYYMNPLDWSALETTRRGSGDASFVGASGAITYVNNGLTPLLWGLPVVTSNTIPAGTIICKSLDADMFLDRQSTVVEMFEQDGDNVQTNLVTIRGEARVIELNFVPAAIRVGIIANITA